MSGPELVIDDLSVSFGGLKAVENISLHAPGGSITGLIGPNGAGKTTTFNACTGFVTPTAGHISLGGRRLDGHSPSRRARWGLGRTFQRMELVEAMTVAENVSIGAESLLTGRRPWGQLWATRRERVDLVAKVEQALARCGIAELAARYTGELSTGQRRLVELARAVASQFKFLLLDEPSSGLDVAETKHLGTILNTLVGGDGIGILLVEHDMALVREACQNVYVLDFGRLIFSGDMAAVMTSDEVKAAYLGSAAIA